MGFLFIAPGAVPLCGRVGSSRVRLRETSGTALRTVRGASRSAARIVQCTATHSENDATEAKPEAEASSLTPSERTPARTSPSARRRLLRLLLLALLVPAHGLAAAVGAGVGTTAGASSFTAGLTASLALVLFSEIGDKTFFISALLSMRYSRLLVLAGTMLALTAMTCISVGIGQALHAVPATLKLGLPLDDYAAVLLLLYFGVQNLREGWAMPSTSAEELDGARDVVGGGAVAATAKSPLRVVSETCSLIFFAEWGDKSMLATIALAAAKNPAGVIVGGVAGHLCASIIAVVGGSLLGKYISERNARIFGGVMFLVFALLTLRGIY